MESFLCAWQTIKEANDLDPASLGFLPPDNFVRKPLIRLVRWKVFEWFMLTVIVANCITLAMQSNAPGFSATRMGMALTYCDYAFIGMFMLEALFKIIALGFLFGQHTYLRSGGCHAAGREDITPKSHLGSMRSFLPMRTSSGFLIVIHSMGGGALWAGSPCSAHMPCTSMRAPMGAAAGQGSPLNPPPCFPPPRLEHSGLLHRLHQHPRVHLDRELHSDPMREGAATAEGHHQDRGAEGEP